MSYEKDAMMIALIAHHGQVDKAGKPYIRHPVAVAESLWNEDDDIKIVALLHDVVEDSEITLNYLRAFFPDSIVDAVDAVTHREDETYNDYVRRAKKNAIGKKVKIADLKHNLSRMEPLEPKDREFLTKRYTKALEILED